MNQRRVLAHDPLLALLWDEYDLCRAKQFVIFKRPKKNSKNMEEFVSIEYPQGFSQLPHAGGVADQNYLKMRVFAAFFRGERAGCVRVLNK